MTLATNHIIRNAIVDFHFNGKTDGFVLQREVRDWFDDFVARLDGELNDISGGDTIVTIDQLQIDVDLTNSNWRQDASRNITRQLKDKIRLIQAGVITSQGYAEKKEEQHVGDSFLYYIQHGHLPWQISTFTATQWDESIAKLVLKADDKFVQALKELLFGSSIYKKRFSKTVPFQTAIDLFRLHQQHDTDDAFIQDLQLLMTVALNYPDNNFQQLLYNLLLVRVADNADIMQIKQTFLQSIQEQVIINPGIISAVSNISFQSQPLIALQKELTAKQENNVYDLQNLKQQEQSLQAQISKQATGEPIYISNAGLVIVAPFLPVFFERTKLGDGQNMIDADAAVCMVNYLATGNEEMQEYELVLPKILCGFSPEVIIDTNIDFSDTLKKQAAELLDSVIEYWSILQNTSVAGLRETFLRRDGKLTLNNNEWMLQVEQKQFDMLLDHLPWNISMIKLAWMPQLLKTEWM